LGVPASGCSSCAAPSLTTAPTITAPPAMSTIPVAPALVSPGALPGPVMSQPATPGPGSAPPSTFKSGSSLDLRSNQLPERNSSYSPVPVQQVVPADSRTTQNSVQSTNYVQLIAIKPVLSLVEPTGLTLVPITRTAPATDRNGWHAPRN
jgi:hypothetical protein